MLTSYTDAGNAVFPHADACIDTVRPRDEAALRARLRDAYGRNLPVTVVGGLTGLTGGAVPCASGVRVDLTALDVLADRDGWRRETPFLLRSLSDPYQVVVAPGATLAALHAALEALGLWYPPPPGETRATIGGNVSTNASGPRTFSFGPTRPYVASLRILLADGDSLTLRRGETFAHDRTFAVRTDAGRVLRGVLPGYTQPAVKHAAGLYVEPDMDLIDLFIGSEGILGIFTEIGLRVVPRRELRTEIHFFPDTDAALACADVLRPLRAQPQTTATTAATAVTNKETGVISLEFFDEGSLDLVRHDARFAARIPAGAGAAIEVETFAEDVLTRTRIADVLTTRRHLASLSPELSMAFRYAVPRRVAEILKERGQPKFGTDFAVPLSAFPQLFASYREMDREFGVALPGHLPRVAKWGHVGDCHIHCNFLCETGEDQELARRIYLKLVRRAVALGGTISAEHGVGKKRLADETGVVHPYLWYQYGGAYREIADVKRVFDPKGLLNPGNMIPPG